MVAPSPQDCGHDTDPPPADADLKAYLSHPCGVRTTGTDTASRVAGLGWLRGFWEDIGISRPTGRRLPSEGEPTAGGEAHPLKEEDKKKNKRNARRAGGSRFSLGWLLQALGPRSSGGGWAAAGPVGKRRPQHTDSEHGVCQNGVCQHGVCQHGACQHPLSQPRQPRDCHVLLRNTQTSRVAGLGWLRGFREDIGISRPTGRRLPSEGEPTAGGEAHPSHAKTDPEPPVPQPGPLKP